VFCIIVRGVKGSEHWRIRRSVEILAYHSRTKTAQILFLLCLENLLPRGKENWLELLHPGRTEHELLPTPWPLPWHVDEKRKSCEYSGNVQTNILTSVYGRAFWEDETGSLRRVACLTPWDFWFDDWERTPVTLWPKEEGIDPGCAMERVPSPGSQSEGESHVPFTAFKLGPFRREGLTLLAFKLRLSGRSYEELVEADRVFTVDGPETLLLRIARKYVPQMHSPPDWFDRLKDFETYVDIGESYDVILLRRGRHCERLRTVRECGIVKAPLQPQPAGVAERYVTASPRFCLSLAYSKNMREAKVRQAVGLV